MFSSGWDVFLKPGSLKISAEELQKYVRITFSHLDDECLHWYLQDGIITYEQYLGLVKDYEAQMATKRAKLKHTRIRRIAFNAIRSDLVLAMIDSGIAYICAYPGCDINEDLTVDHVIPLSRGGSDDLSNLQFLCQPHNSSKRDRVELCEDVDDENRKGYPAGCHNSGFSDLRNRGPVPAYSSETDFLLNTPQSTA